MKYLTGLLQSPAVPTNTVVVGTARLCNNPVKYFTVKKFASLAIISQNPGFIEIQVLELVYSIYIRVSQLTQPVEKCCDKFSFPGFPLHFQKLAHEAQYGISCNKNRLGACPRVYW